MVGNHIKMAIRIVKRNPLFGSMVIGGITLGITSFCIKILSNGPANNTSGVILSLFIFLLVSYIIQAFYEKSGNKELEIRKMLGATSTDIFIQFFIISNLFVFMGSIFSIALIDIILVNTRLFLYSISTQLLYKADNLIYFLGITLGAGVFTSVVPFIFLHKKNIL